MINYAMETERQNKRANWGIRDYVVIKLVEEKTLRLTKDKGRKEDDILTGDDVLVPQN